MYQTLISVSEAAQGLTRSDWRFFDCRFGLGDTDAGRAAYAESHIPGALYAHLDDDLSAAEPVTDAGRHPLPSQADMIALFSRWGIGPETQVVAYDDTKGAFASRLWWMLRYMGHDKVAVLNGGWSAWLSGGNPVDAIIPEVESIAFQANPRPDWLVTLDEVTQQTLIDSRAEARYRGEVEPIDPRAGHIPEARNHHFANNFDASGAMLDSEALQGILAPLFEEKSPEETTFYCGSGVTACVNLLAVAHAGLGTPKLYVGSWSEWSRDPNRPGEVGE